MVIGFLTQTTARCGSRTKEDSDRTTPMVIGCTPIMDGHGDPITIGDGRLFIMAVGFRIPSHGGCGSRVTNGLQRGFHGGAVEIIMAGHHLDRK